MNENVVLVTGAAGFVGFHLSLMLLEKGVVVVGLDSMSTYYDVSLKHQRLNILNKFTNFQFIQGNLEDFDLLKSIGKRFPISKVFHLAAQAGVRHSIDEPRDYLKSNIIGTFNILEFCILYKIEHLLLASTSSAYGNKNQFPLLESMKCDQPMSFYAATKKSTEIMAHSYSHIHCLPVTIFRFFTVYGPWGRPDMALFKFINAMLNGRPIDIYNNGEMERDFTYVTDLVDCIYQLGDVLPPQVGSVGRDNLNPLDSLSPIAPHRIVNIGSNRPIKLMEFINLIEDELGFKAKKNFMGMQAGDIEATHASIDLMESLIGVKQFTPIATGISSFIKWYKEYYDVN